MVGVANLASVATGPLVLLLDCGHRYEPHSPALLDSPAPSGFAERAPPSLAPAAPPPYGPLIHRDGHVLHGASGAGDGPRGQGS